MVRARIGLSSLEPLLEALERSARAFVEAMRGVQSKSVALGCVLTLGGCGPSARVEIEGVVRDGRTGAPIAGALVASDDGATAETDEDGRFAMEVEEGAGRMLTANAAGRCPATETVDVRPGGSNPQVTLHLHSAVAIEDGPLQVGFDAEVRLRAQLRCDPDEPLEWTQVAGTPLGEDRLRTEEGGALLVIQTPPLDEVVELEDRFGIVPLDRAQRGDYRFEVRGSFGGVESTWETRVLSAPTSAGVYQVPTGADVYFNGGPADTHEWVLDTRPDESETEMIDPSSRIAHLRPDQFGTYNIVHRPSGMQVSLQAGPYEGVPRDCGRSRCHAAEDEGWEETAHARTFRRGLAGELGAEFEERCWSCHATGVDPGIENGGLHQTASRLGWEQPPPDASIWDSAPRLVRRHGNVWCSACHGPGRIVPPQFRWQYGAKYQVGVCARCHDVDDDDPDANHRSPHVDEWRLSPMSRFARELAEDDPALRAECARCHSAQGFVEWRRRDRRVAPDPVTVAPISCPTCHDSHDTTRPRGLRLYDTSDALADDTPVDRMGLGAICATCHRAGDVWDGADDAAPHAPQTNLLLGVGAQLATRPAADNGHRTIANTCNRCHMTRPPEGDALRETVGGHTFSVRARAGEAALSPSACAPCHGDTAPESVGARDWNGDGDEGPIAEEHDAALLAVSGAFTTRVTALGLADGCSTSRQAADVSERDARLHLVDGRGGLLGDCDGDGSIGEGEEPYTVTRLPTELRQIAHDLALLRADGSRGVHNPAYTFAILDGLSRALE